MMNLGPPFRNPPDLFRKRLADHPHQVHPLQLRTNLQIMSEWKRHFDAKARGLGHGELNLVRQLRSFLLTAAGPIFLMEMKEGYFG